jgi:hypothetical protein
VLRIWKKEAIGGTGDLLFPQVKKAIEDIPRQELGLAWGVKGDEHLNDTQDFIAGKPRAAFQKWLRHVHKVSPKLGKYIRSIPENASLVYYVFMARVSGQMMADQIFKRYFETESDNPKAKKSAEAWYQKAHKKVLGKAMARHQKLRADAKAKKSDEFGDERDDWTESAGIGIIGLLDEARKHDFGGPNSLRSYGDSLNALHSVRDYLSRLAKSDSDKVARRVSAMLMRELFDWRTKYRDIFTSDTGAKVQYPTGPLDAHNLLTAAMSGLRAASLGFKDKDQRKAVNELQSIASKAVDMLGNWARDRNKVSESRRRGKLEYIDSAIMHGADPVFDILNESNRIGFQTINERSRTRLEEERGGDKVQGQIYYDVDNTHPGDFGGYGSSVRRYAIRVWGNTYQIKDELKKLGFRFDKKDPRKSWVLYHAYSTNPESSGGMFRGSVSEKKIDQALPKLKKLVDDFNKRMAASNQKTIAKVGIQPDNEPADKSVKAQIDRVLSNDRRTMRLKRYGIEMKMSWEGNGTLSQADVSFTGNTYPIRGVLKKAGFRFDGSSKRWTLAYSTYEKISKRLGNLIAKELKKSQGDRPSGEDPSAPQPGPDLTTRLKHHKAWKAQPFEDSADEVYWREKMDPIKRNAKKYNRHIVGEGITGFLGDLEEGRLEEKRVSGMDMRDVLKGRLFPTADKIMAAADKFKTWANKTVYKKRVSDQMSQTERDVGAYLTGIRHGFEDFEGIVGEGVLPDLQDALSRGSVSDKQRFNLMKALVDGDQSAWVVTDSLAKRIEGAADAIHKIDPKVAKSMLSGPLSGMDVLLRNFRSGLSMTSKMIQSSVSGLKREDEEFSFAVMVEAVDDGWLFTPIMDEAEIYATNAMRAMYEGSKGEYVFDMDTGEKIGPMPAKEKKSFLKTQKAALVAKERAKSNPTPRNVKHAEKMGSLIKQTLHAKKKTASLRAGTAVIKKETARMKSARLKKKTLVKGKIKSDQAKLKLGPGEKMVFGRVVKAGGLVNDAQPELDITQYLGEVAVNDSRSR